MDEEEGGSKTMSLSLNLVRIICGSCVLHLVAIVCLEVCSKLRLLGRWLGGLYGK